MNEYIVWYLNEDDLQEPAIRVSADSLISAAASVEGDPNLECKEITQVVKADDRLKAALAKMGLGCEFIPFPRKKKRK